MIHDGQRFLVVSAPLATRGGDVLTAAEAAVVRYAASGLRTAQIAELRGTSRTTVANQLASSYSKLGVSSRRELAALLFGNGVGG